MPFAPPHHEKAPFRGRPRKSPPFVKGGLGGFYTYIYTYTPPATTANPMLRRMPLAGGVLPGMRRGVWQREGKSLQPPFCERGAF